MNRIILVGNGFDLAHDLKTSYKDFLLDFYKLKFKEAIASGIKTKVNSHKTGYFYEDVLVSIIFPRLGNLKEVIEQVCSTPNLEDFHQVFKRHSGELTVNSEIIKEYFKTWSSFEKSYFDLLSKNYETEGKIKKLNEEFDLIRVHLKNYLTNIQIDFDNSKIEQSQIDKLLNVFTEGEIDELLFLSFNYTNTLGYYFNRASKKIRANIIYLHGNLNSTDEDGHIVLGYDDDKDVNFSKIITHANIENLCFFKSVQYPINTNRNDLSQFIEFNDFEVYAFGHSFEKSDFTILREIFTHKNCIKIKVFYHPEDKDNDFISKSQLLRIMFHDSMDNMKKLVVRSQSEPMPILVSNFKEIK
jgi:hypothetical protein